MDPEYCLQDLIRCHLCETPVPPLYCDFCRLYLCIACEGEHISDGSRRHIVVRYKKRRKIHYTCLKHSTQLCDIYCEQCDIPICLECVSSGEHLDHKQDYILNVLEDKTNVIQKDLQELETYIYPKYEEILSYILATKAGLKRNSLKLTTAIDKHGEVLHREIDIAIKRLKSDLDEMESKNLVVLNKQENEINCIIFKIKEIITNLNTCLNSNEVSAYKSRNTEFRKLPPTITVSLPIFTPQMINGDHIYQQFGSFSSLPYRPLIDKPRIISDIKTEYGVSNGLRSVSCLSDDNLWTCGEDNMMRLYNLHGELVKKLQTKSRQAPGDVAVTHTGKLVYADYHDETVNIVNNKKKKAVIRLRGWRPCNLCSTFSGDLLVAMISNDMEQAKVVRYSGATDKQTIQFDDSGQPFYSSAASTKYICESKNLDVCVADSCAGAVVVVNQAGKLRFTYTGQSSKAQKKFTPQGITTDSQSRILSSDSDNYQIHILDEDGQFLRYIDSYHLQHPYGICVDIRDNLFVANAISGKLLKIEYCV